MKLSRHFGGLVLKNNRLKKKISIKTRVIYGLTGVLDIADKKYVIIRLIKVSITTFQKKQLTLVRQSETKKSCS